MGNIQRISLFILCFICCIACKQKPDQGSDSLPLSTPDLNLSRMDWIIGSWLTDAEKSLVIQNWLKHNDSLVIAENTIVVEADTLFHHTLKIYPADGSIILETIPLTIYEEPAKYMMIVNKSGEHVFEDKMKAFPQRIIFLLNTDGSLYYRLEGAIDGQAQYQDFTLYKEE